MCIGGPKKPPQSDKGGLRIPVKQEDGRDGEMVYVDDAMRDKAFKIGTTILAFLESQSPNDVGFSYAIVTMIKKHMEQFHGCKPSDIQFQTLEDYERNKTPN